MAFVRKMLPPTSVLCAFEASARLQSFTAAAQELHLTQSAVSRQIRLLEDMLGSELFVRERQTVRATVAGEAYANEIREALNKISLATLGFRANPQGGVLNLAILPTFGTRWLAPRLPKFLVAHPGITLNLTTRLAPFDFHSDPQDAAVHFGLPDWPNAQSAPLMTETLVPACGPQFRKHHQFEHASELLHAPLLHLSSRPDAWKRWFAEVGLEVNEVPGMVVDQFAMAAQAAMANLGVALLPKFLMEAEFASGVLVEAIRPAILPVDNVDRPERYYLVWPNSRSSYPPVQAFRAWVQAEANPPAR